MDPYLSRAPSLTSSEGGTGSESNLMTPADRSPEMIAQQYSLPLDTLALQPVAHNARAIPQLPEINDPKTAVRPVESLCCIGAGYVGTSPSTMIPAMLTMPSLADLQLLRLTVYRWPNGRNDRATQPSRPRNSRRPRPKTHRCMEEQAPPHPRARSLRRSPHSQRRPTRPITKPFLLHSLRRKYRRSRHHPHQRQHPDKTARPRRRKSYGHDRVRGRSTRCGDVREERVYIGGEEHGAVQDWAVDQEYYGGGSAGAEFSRAVESGVLIGGHGDTGPDAARSRNNWLRIYFAWASRCCGFGESVRCMGK